MYLLIFESLGTWELLVVGMVALIVFGPRKIPEMARKAGKIMAEFKKVSNDFRTTWEQEVDLTEDEQSALDFSDRSIAREKSPLIASEAQAKAVPTNEDDDFRDTTAELPVKQQTALPEIRELTDESKIEALKNPSLKTNEEVSEKKNWL